MRPRHISPVVATWPSNFFLSVSSSRFPRVSLKNLVFSFPSSLPLSASRVTPLSSTCDLRANGSASSAISSSSLLRQGEEKTRGTPSSSSCSAQHRHHRQPREVFAPDSREDPTLLSSRTCLSTTHVSLSLSCPRHGPTLRRHLQKEGGGLVGCFPSIAISAGDEQRKRKRKESSVIRSQTSHRHSANDPVDISAALPSFRDFFFSVTSFAPLAASQSSSRTRQQKEFSSLSASCSPSSSSSPMMTDGVLPRRERETGGADTGGRTEAADLTQKQGQGEEECGGEKEGQAEGLRGRRRSAGDGTDCWQKDLVKKKWDAVLRGAVSIDNPTRERCWPQQPAQDHSVRGFSSYTRCTLKGVGLEERRRLVFAPSGT